MAEVFAKLGVEDRQALARVTRQASW
jgi:hypothetical protein